MKVIFMRHVESEYNVKDLINQDSSVKVRITKKGWKQALEAGKKLKDMDFDIIFASEFLRVRETAEIIRGKRDVEIKIDKRINEIKLGFEGKGAENYRRARMESGEKISMFKVSIELENFYEVRKRVEKFINWLKLQKYFNCDARNMCTECKVNS